MKIKILDTDTLIFHKSRYYGKKCELYCISHMSILEKKPYRLAQECVTTFNSLLVTVQSSGRFLIVLTIIAFYPVFLRSMSHTVNNFSVIMS